MNGSFYEDRDLVLRCLAGQRKAAEMLVRRFSDLVYRSVQYTLEAKNVPFSRPDVEDLHGTIFLRLFDHGCRKLGQYEGRNGCSLASWVRIVAVRAVLDHLREKGVDALSWRERKVPLERLPELAEDLAGPEAAVERGERKRMVQMGVEKLPPRDRLFLKLHFEEGLLIAEVAETMGLSLDHAYTIKHRAIQRLKSFVASMPSPAS
jgi:RNA polymerase sigma factor (sigma-70 family)